jgi:hypothetical protein
MAGDAVSMLAAAGLVANGPFPWGAAVTPDAPGVYVVETSEAHAVAPIDIGTVAAWIGRVPTLMVDGRRPTPGDLAERLREFWIPTDRVVYIGLAGTSVRRRIRAFGRTPLGDPRPHAGGHWIKTLSCLNDLLIWTAATSEPERYEDALLTAFQRRNASAESPSKLVLPFANRQSAAGVRKQHGISGSTLPRTPRESSVVPAPTLGSSPPRATVTGQLDVINEALQAYVCAQPSGRVTAVEAARELDRLGILRDSSIRAGLPLRNLLRAGRIAHAYQEGGRWWVIECAQPRR